MNISYKPSQCRITDYWANDTAGTYSPSAEISFLMLISNYIHVARFLNCIC